MRPSASFIGFMMCFFTGALALAQDKLIASDLRITGNSHEAHIEMDFDGKPEVTSSLLSGPYRLVLDLPETSFSSENVQPKSGGLANSYRSGLMQEGRSRLVIAMNGPFSADAPMVKPSADGRMFTLSVAVKATSKDDFAKVLENQVLTTSSIAGGKGDRIVGDKPDTPGMFTVVLDPGHGGIDGGAVGVHGAVEKQNTLSFAKELRDRFKGNQNIRVFLTREDDRFIALDERVRIGRQLNANLFISIHADTIANPLLRGATVYTLSDKASDDVAHAVAQQENLSDAIGGVDIKVDDKQVADILIDLTRRETMQFSVKYARSVVSLMQDKVRMINHPQRSAGFRVLRAPDVASILVELGYLSNVDDEKEMADPAWRKGVLDVLAKSIEDYALTQRVAAQ